MNVLEHCPVFRIVFQLCFVLEGLGIGLKIDDISTVFLLGQNLLHGGLALWVQVGLNLFAAFQQPLNLPVYHRNKHLALLQNAGYRFRSFTLQCHFENVLHNGCRLQVYDPLFLLSELFI